MKNILALLAFAFFITCSTTANAGEKLRSSVAYQQIDDAGRTYLSECISNKANSIKHCVKQTKKMMKEQYKAAKMAENKK